MKILREQGGNSMLFTTSKQSRKQQRQTMILTLVGMAFSLVQTMWLFYTVKQENK